MNLALRWRPFAVAFAICLAVAIVGSTLTELGPWYRGLRQPAWKPPDAAFGVIWSAIFFFAALSGSLAWSAALDTIRRRWVLTLFLVNAALNLLWSWLYFAQRRPDWAMVEYGFLWISVLSLVVGLWRTSRLAAVLNLPYLVWVSTAGLLNWAAVVLNGPFGQSSRG